MLNDYYNNYIDIIFIIGYTAVLWKIQQQNEYIRQGRSVTMVTKQATSTGTDRTRKRKRKEETDICKKKRRQ